MLNGYNCSLFYALIHELSQEFDVVRQNSQKFELQEFDDSNSCFPRVKLPFFLFKRVLLR